MLPLLCYLHHGLYHWPLLVRVLGLEERAGAVMVLSAMTSVRVRVNLLISSAVGGYISTEVPT